jgi:GNAT superfamily N-acetyltransferase
VALLRGTALEFDLQLAFAPGVRARGRVTAVRRPYFDVAWLSPARTLQHALADYLLAADPALTPAALRGAGLAVGNLGHAAVFDYADSTSDGDEILALRLRAHQAEGHLAAAGIDDLRSPFDAHARHLTCRVGGRIVGYVRVIFVDGVAAKSQYVSWGGHEVPRWLWAAGFVEAGAGAIDPDFQGTGLFSPLMRHTVRVAIQSGHRYVLGACDDELLPMYRALGYEVLEERIVEPRPGWRFRSHLLVLDAAAATTVPHRATPELEVAA